MPAVDITKLTAPISPDEPCGPDLAYDPRFMEVEDLARGTPERTIGDSVIPPEPPDWGKVLSATTDLLGRTKDLRVLKMFAIAQIEKNGLAGANAAMQLLAETLRQHWPDVHPKLEPDDADAIERVNILQELSNAPGTFGDETRFIRRLQTVALTNSKQMGRYGLFHLKVATGEMTTGGIEMEIPEASTIDAAFQDTETADLEQAAADIAATRESIDTINASLIDAIGSAAAPNFNELDKALLEMATLVDEHLTTRGLGTGIGIDGASEGSGASAPTAPGEIRSRHDVVQALERICNYYEQAEPSSPIPILLNRAKRLAHKNFVDIVKDLTPGAMDALETLAGETYREE